MPESDVRSVGVSQRSDEGAGNVRDTVVRMSLVQGATARETEVRVGLGQHDVGHGVGLGEPRRGHEHVAHAGHVAVQDWPSVVGGARHFARGLQRLGNVDLRVGLAALRPRDDGARAHVAVEEREVVGDDRDGERHHQHPAHGAGGADDVADGGGRVDVTVAHCRHGDDGPPEAHGDGGEHVPRAGGVLALCIVDHGGEDEHADEQEDEEHQQLLKAGLKGVDEHFERLVVLDQVEDTEHPDNPQDEHDLDHEPLVEVARLQVGALEDDGDVQRHQSQQVDDVHQGDDESPFVGSEREPEHELEREEHRADDVQHIQRLL